MSRKLALMEMDKRLSMDYYSMKRTNLIKTKTKRKTEEVQNLTRMSWLKFVTWVTVAGLIITSPLRFKQDSIGLQRSLLVQITIHQQMFGVLPAQFLKWLLEIFSLNQEKVVTTTRMMTILLK